MSEKAQRIIFETGVTDTLQDSNRAEEEPQVLKIRAQNSSNIFIDVQSRSTQLDIPPVSILLSSTNNSLYLRNIVRLAVSKIFVQWQTPNINSRNNVVTYFSSVTGTLHSSLIPTGFYNTRLIAMNALVVALNAPFFGGASGLVFSHVIQPLNPTCSLLSAVGGNFRFELSSPMIVFGEQLFNLPKDQTPTASKFVGSMALLYTRYIDFRSRILNQWTKNPNTSNRSGANNLLFRFFLNNPLGIEGPLAETIQNLVYFAQKPSFTIQSPDFQLNDQFGFTLITGQCAEETSSGFFWDIVLVSET